MKQDDVRGFLEILPKLYEAKDVKTYGSELDGKCGFNNGVEASAKKLSENEAGEEDVASALPETDWAYKTRRDLAKALRSKFIILKKPMRGD